MPLHIEKVGEKKFTAVWSSREGHVLKRIDTPHGEKDLLEVLTQSGCHPTDIFDALESTDPKLPSDVTESMKKQLNELVRQGNYKPGKQRT